MPKTKSASIRTLFEDAGNTANVIFIHGLGNKGDECWGFESGSAWLNALRASPLKLNLYSACYPNSATKLFGHAMTLFERANSMLSLLTSSGKFDRPTVLIAYSMGGLMAKQLLRLADQQPDGHAAIANIRGIVFIATPHSGASLATVLHALTLSWGSAAATIDLLPNNSNVRDIGHWFRAFAARTQLPVIAFAETRRTRFLRVVSVSNADPGIPDIIPIAIDANHFAICKPPEADNPVIIETLVFIEKALRNTKKATLAEPPPSESHNINTIKDITGSNISVTQTYVGSKPAG